MCLDFAVCGNLNNSTMLFYKVMNELRNQSAIVQTQKSDKSTYFGGIYVSHKKAYMYMCVGSRTCMHWAQHTEFVQFKCILACSCTLGNPG